MDEAANLGQGNFTEPAYAAMSNAMNSAHIEKLGFAFAVYVYRDLLGLDDVNPLRNKADTYFKNIAMSFLGNSQLTTRSSKLPKTSTGNLLKQDQILEGRTLLFSGSSQFKQMVWLVLPAVTLFYAAAVAAALRNFQERPLPYLRRQLIAHCRGSILGQMQGRPGASVLHNC